MWIILSCCQTSKLATSKQLFVCLCDMRHNNATKKSNNLWIQNGQKRRRCEHEEQLSGLNTSLLLCSPHVIQWIGKAEKMRECYQSVQQSKTTQTRTRPWLQEFPSKKRTRRRRQLNRIATLQMHNGRKNSNFSPLLQIYWTHKYEKKNWDNSNVDGKCSHK